jgi:hypothetical protein
MFNYEQCRRRADVCVTWAAEAGDYEQQRGIFLKMAMCWLKLAEKAPDHPDRKKL